MKITITAMMLCDLCGGKFTLEACEKLCELYEESECAPHIGDICVSYGELPAADMDEDEGYSIIAHLGNGNVLYEF